MNIDLIISAKNIDNEKIKNKTVIVIDMLRATSVIITALKNGCKEVRAVLTIDEAVKIADSDRKNYILGGERDAVKIKGFDFSNSPIEYTENKISGKKLIMTTTNGTKAINGCKEAKSILIAAMINAKAAAKQVIELNNDLVIVNAGTNGEFSIDDFICSGYIISLIKADTDVKLMDIATTALYVYKQNTDIKNFIKYANHYKKIEELGLYEDLEYCCQKDIIDIVPEFKDEVIK